MLEKIIFNAPSWDRTGRLQFRIAEIYENTGEPDMAIESFSTLLTRYPGSPHAEEAAFRRALCHSKLAHSYPNSAETRASAAMAAAEFLQRFPRSKHAQKVRDILERLDDAQAKELFKIARIYDRTHSRPVAAVFMYEQFLSQYPDSPLAENARKRIAALKPTIQGGNP
jgi:outer membrane protein assembly factor BamD